MPQVRPPAELVRLCNANGIEGLPVSNAKSPNTATAMFLQADKLDKKLSMSQSCGHMYSTPKTGACPYHEGEAELTNSQCSSNQPYKTEP